MQFRKMVKRLIYKFHRWSSGMTHKKLIPSDEGFIINFVGGVYSVCLYE